MESEIATSVSISSSALASIGAILASVFSGIGSSIGMSIAGTKGSGVIAEKPHLSGKVTILSAMPGSQAIYGLVVTLLILRKMGAFDTSLIELSSADGYALFAAGGVMGFAGLFSGWFQGKVSAGGMGAIARNDSVLAKAITLSALVETTALFGLLGAVLVMLMVGK